MNGRFLIQALLPGPIEGGSCDSKSKENRAFHRKRQGCENCKQQLYDNLAPMKIETDRLRTVQVMRYVTPLREGGSLPAIAEADDGFLYVLKFRGAGQGPKALIADLLGGEIARACGLKVPEIVFTNLDESFGRTEPDPEIQDLLRASEGLNFGIH